MGSDPSLIGLDQYALGINLTNRGDLIKTRPPFEQQLLNTDAVTDRWTGKFQGAGWYNGPLGESSFIIARGGRLFKATVGTGEFVLSEITPVILIQVTANFTVPAIGNTVVASVTDEEPFTVGQVLFIDSGSYTVSNRYTDQLLLTYNGGAANAVVIAGAPILDSNNVEVKAYKEHDPNYDMVFMFQANNYEIICRNQFKTVFFDGASAREAGIKEIPPSVFGAFGLGRIWFTLPNLQNYGAGDIEFGPSGSIGLGFTDAILKVTENDFLNEGGYFGISSSSGTITGMQFLALQDTSLGLGPLLIGATNAIYTNQAPIDRTTWKNLTYPIQTISLLEYGPLGPRNMVPAGGDVWFRAIDGLRSFIIARRNFPAPGNTPQSFEVSPLLDEDTEFLLQFGSGMLFDNRILMTVSPYRSDLGILHRGIVSMNNDLVSSLRRKDPIAYESVWSGLNVFQILKAQIEGVERGFAFVEHDGEIALWEIQTSGYYDVSKTVSGNNFSITRSAVEQVLITRMDDCQTPEVLKELYSAELYLDELVDTVTVKVEYRPDQYPIFQTWATITLCNTVTQCTITPPTGATCIIWKSRAPGYAARLLLPQPLDNCSQTGLPVRKAFEHQYKLTITGHARVRRFKPHTKLVSMPMQGQDGCEEGVVCKTIEACSEPLIGSYSSYGV